MDPSGEISNLLQTFDPDNPNEVNRLWTLMYDELHRLARLQINQVHPGRTLDSHALVHECFLRIRLGKSIEAKNRKYFYGVARQAMRNVIIDYIRARTTGKRGGRMPHISLDEATTVFPTTQDAEALACLIEVLDRLERSGEDDPSQRLVKEAAEYQLYEGLTQEKIAQRMNRSSRMVRRYLMAFKVLVRNHCGPI